MPAPTKRPAKSVLIVDPSAENREVLRTALTRRGLRIFEAEAAAAGMELAGLHQPDVIVIDDEAEPVSDAVIPEHFPARSGDHEGRFVILGKVRSDVPPAQCHIIAKPYHFAPLIHTIERLATKAA